MIGVGSKLVYPKTVSLSFSQFKQVLNKNDQHLNSTILSAYEILQPDKSMLPLIFTT
jgi:hypothetical protein